MYLVLFTNVYVLFVGWLAAGHTWCSSASSVCGSASSGFSDDDGLAAAPASGLAPPALLARVRSLGRAGLVQQYNEIKQCPPTGTFTHTKLVQHSCIHWHSNPWRVLIPSTASCCFTPVPFTQGVCVHTIQLPKQPQTIPLFKKSLFSLLCDILAICPAQQSCLI